MFSGDLHERSDDRPDCKTKVEGGVAPGLSYFVLKKLKISVYETLTVAFLSGNLAIKMERLEVQVAAAPTP